MNIQQQLKDAIFSSDVHNVRELLNNGADPNYKCEYSLLKIDDGVVYNATYLHEILLEQPMHSLVMVKELLEHGADPNKCSDGDITPLHLACHEQYFNVSIARLLLRNGANVNATSNILWTLCTPLTLAVETKNVELISLLLSYHPNNCHAALLYAIQGHPDNSDDSELFYSIDVVKVLMCKVEDIPSIRKIASENNRVDTLQLLTA